MRISDRSRERDFNGDGLMELASIPWDLADTDEVWSCIECGEKQGAMWESGIDNSTMWDDAVFNPQHHCLDLSYVGLNALMVADCELLAKIARLLGKENDADELDLQGQALSERINAALWNENEGRVYT